MKVNQQMILLVSCYNNKKKTKNKSDDEIVEVFDKFFINLVSC